MVMLRATKRLLSRLPASGHGLAASDTALGDWYANRIVVDRRPLVLLVSQNSLLPILEVARDVRQLPDRLAGIVDARLRRLGIDERLIVPEVNAMNPVAIGPTAARSVVGTMVDFAFVLPYYLADVGWGALEQVEAHLARTPCRVSSRGRDVIFPDRATRSLLESRWGRGP
jgi:hypothetical protein